MTTAPCPTPDKVCHSTLRGAATQMLDVFEQHGVWQRPYRCDCGEYHLTSRDLDGQPVTAAQAEQLLAAVL